MFRFFFFTLSFGLFLLGGCQTSSIGLVDLKEGNGRAGILMKVEGVAPGSKNFVIPQTLEIVPFDPLSVDEEGRFKLTGIGVDLDLHDAEMGYVFSKVKPGNYLLRNISQQLFFYGCFQNDTVQFEVKEDTIVFIGTFDAKVNFERLALEARRQGKTVAASHDKAVIFDGIGAPALSQATDNEFEDARKFLITSANGIALPLRTISLRKGNAFQTGQNLFGNRTCQ